MSKVSCSCVGNMTSIVSSHNRTILNPDINLEYGCNCRSRNDCPLQNKCLTPKTDYRANVKNDINGEKNFVLGLPKQFSKSISEIRKKTNFSKYKNSTKLSK